MLAQHSCQWVFNRNRMINKWTLVFLLCFRWKYAVAKLCILSIMWMSSTTTTTLYLILFLVLQMISLLYLCLCTVLLPPGDNPIAVNKYIIYATVRNTCATETVSDTSRSVWCIRYSHFVQEAIFYISDNGNCTCSRVDIGPIHTEVKFVKHLVAWIHTCSFLC